MNSVKLKYNLDMEPESVWLFVTPSEVAKNTIVYVQELGDFISHKKYFTQRQDLSSYLIKYTLSGEGVLKYGEKKYLVRPNQLFWIDCRNPQYYQTSQEKGEWHVLWVHFYGANSSSYYEHFLKLNNHSNVVDMPAINGVETAIRSLISYTKENGHTLVKDIQASGILINLMAECIHAAATNKPQRTIPETVSLSRTYMLTNFHEHISLDDISRRYAISKYYFEKLFKHHMGITPNEFLIRTRINHAKELLRTTNDLVGEICEKVGIPNTNHFINLFKKREGVTPGVYRKMWLNNNI